MREIKYRAWDLKNKIMYQPEQIARIHFDKGIPYAITLWDAGMLLRGDFILLEYTGLKDKNNEKVYEKDILKWNNENCLVGWEDGRWICWLKDFPEPIFQKRLKYMEVVSHFYKRAK